MRPADIWFLEGSIKLEIEADDNDTRAAPISYTSPFTIEDHLKLNKSNFDQFEKKSVLLQNGPRYFLVSPAAFIPSECVNPGLFMSCDGIESLNDLANHLQAPKDWQARIDFAFDDKRVTARLNRLRSRNDTDSDVKRCDAKTF